MIALMKGDAKVVGHIQSLDVAQLTLCVPVQAEFWFGVARSVMRNSREFGRVPSLWIENWIDG